MAFFAESRPRLPPSTLRFDEMPLDSSKTSRAAIELNYATVGLKICGEQFIQLSHWQLRAQWQSLGPRNGGAESGFVSPVSWGT